MTGDRFAIRIRDHSLAVDQPVIAGGMDAAPAPTEVFVSALAACVAHYAHGYLVRHHIDATGLRVTADFEVGGRPPRITAVEVHLTPPPALPPERYPAFRAVAAACTLHNTLDEPPTVSIDLPHTEKRIAS
jgi:putative redox protein